MKWMSPSPRRVRGVVALRHLTDAYAMSRLHDLTPLGLSKDLIEARAWQLFRLDETEQYTAGSNRWQLIHVTYEK